MRASVRMASAPGVSQAGQLAVPVLRDVREGVAGVMTAALATCAADALLPGPDRMCCESRNAA
jgi:hypothetical protein